MFESSMDDVSSINSDSKPGLMFLDKPAEERSRLLKQSIDHLSEAVKKEQPSFALLVYGSGLYGYNSQEIGKLDDLDLLAISSRNYKFGEILDSLVHIGIEIENDSYLQVLSDNLKSNKIDFFRIKGIYQNIITSIHFFAYDSLDNKHSPLQAFNPIYGGLTDKQKVEKQEVKSPRIEIGFDGVMHSINYDYLGGNNQFSSAKYSTAISRTIHPNEGTINPTIGVQAEKILNSKLIYEPETVGQSKMNIEKLLEKYWRTFVRSALMYKPSATNDEIVDLLARSKRYSQSYRNLLYEKIEFEKNRLTMQKINR